MVSKSWAVTLVPLIVYLLGFGYSIVTGTDFSTQQSDMLKDLLYVFLGSGSLGVANRVLAKK